MNLQEDGFFVDGTPSPEPEADGFHKLEVWQRVCLCLAFLAMLAVYTDWLLER